MSLCISTPVQGPNPTDYVSCSLALAATRVLLALNHETPDQAAYDQELKDSELSTEAQLQAEEFVPSYWVMTVEYDQLPETEGLVNVHCVGPACVPCYLQVSAATGTVTRI